MDYKALEEHIKDSVMEEQAKLGFRPDQSYRFGDLRDR